MLFEGNKMEIEKAIKTRRSIRKFTDKIPSREEIVKLIDAANFAPSGCNYQNWRFIIINDPTLKQKIIDRGCASFLKDAPIWILVLYHTKTRNPCYLDWITSGSMAAQNIMLQAHKMGMGTCFVNNLPRVGELSRLLNIPKKWDIIGLIALGYPSEKPKALPRKYQPEELISYNQFLFDTSKLPKVSIMHVIFRLIYFHLPLFVRKRVKKIADRREIKKFK